MSKKKQKTMNRTLESWLSLYRALTTRLTSAGCLCFQIWQNPYLKNFEAKILGLLLSVYNMIFVAQQDTAFVDNWIVAWLVINVTFMQIWFKSYFSGS
jgi:hypothetical protein